MLRCVIENRIAIVETRADDRLIRLIISAVELPNRSTVPWGIRVAKVKYKQFHT